MTLYEYPYKNVCHIVLSLRMSLSDKIHLACYTSAYHAVGLSLPTALFASMNTALQEFLTKYEY